MLSINNFLLSFFNLSFSLLFVNNKIDNLLLQLYVVI
nr:MAG TPA: hypothetical protein [Caudoviricetes sp.]